MISRGGVNRRKTDVSKKGDPSGVLLRRIKKFFSLGTSESNGTYSTKARKETPPVKHRQSVSADAYALTGEPAGGSRAE